MKEPEWLMEAVVLSLHKRQLAEHGGQEGVRDANLLGSALARPQNLYAYGEPDLAHLAGAYAYGLACNHPFLDGNKRSAYVACRLFLNLNDWDLRSPLEERYSVFIRLAEGSLTEEALSGWIRQQMEPFAQS